MLVRSLQCLDSYTRIRVIKERIPIKYEVKEAGPRVRLLPVIGGTVRTGRI